jgi:hypothetical protein
MNAIIDMSKDPRITARNITENSKGIGNKLYNRKSLSISQIVTRKKSTRNIKRRKDRK